MNPNETARGKWRKKIGKNKFGRISTRCKILAAPEEIRRSPRNFRVFVRAIVTIYRYGDGVAIPALPIMQRTPFASLASLPPPLLFHLHSPVVRFLFKQRGVLGSVLLNRTRTKCDDHGRRISVAKSRTRPRPIRHPSPYPPPKWVTFKFGGGGSRSSEGPKYWGIYFFHLFS